MQINKTMIKKLNRLTHWLIWQNWFFVCVLSSVILIWLALALHFDSFGSIIIDNLYMSVTMLAGSFVAGSSPAGGGSVAFPVMTLVYKIPPATARNFSLAVQSFGMTAASLMIIKLKAKVEWRGIFYGAIGGVSGITLGSLFVAPFVSNVYAKLLFASIFISFGFVLWRLNQRGRKVCLSIPYLTKKDKLTLITLGGLGGVISSITGSGIDLLIFSVLTLRYKIGEDVATPSSVILMAFISIIGALLHLLVLKDIDNSVFNYLLATVPVVIIGAPVGAWFIKRQNRQFIAKFLYCILVIQYATAIIVIKPNVVQMAFSVLTIALGLAIFFAMSRQKILLG